MIESRRKVNIVGGGIAGLLAAIELARSGVQVTVFEAAAELGGRARTKQTDGFSLNQGPHALYITGAFKRELDRLGIPYTGQKTNPAEPQGLYRGRLHRLPTSLSTLAFSSLFSVSEKLAFAGRLEAVKTTTSPSPSPAVTLKTRLELARAVCASGT